MQHEINLLGIDPHPYTLAVIKASWHEDLLSQMQVQAEEVIKSISAKAKVEVYTVAGTLEIPQLLSFLAKQKKTDAAVVLGCVIRGETSHYDHICDTVFPAIDEVARRYDYPVGNAILSTENLQQAVERVDGTHAFKGKEAAEAALHLAQTYRKVGKDD